MDNRENPRRLKPGNWARENWERLNRLLEENAFQGRYACFDFDDTTSIHPVDSALLYYQIYSLGFVLTPEELSQVLQTGIPDLDCPLGVNEMGVPVTGRQVMGDLTADYAWLWANRGRFEEEALRWSPEYLSFQAKLFWLRKYLDQNFPMEITYPWCVYLMAGHRPEELDRLSREALRFALRPGGYGRKTLCSPRVREGASGPLSVTVEVGTVFSPEIRDLYRALQANGIQPYLISASPAELVKAANDVLCLGLPQEHIFAMRMKQGKDGRYRPLYDDRLPDGRPYAKTFGKGKREIISTLIAPAHGNQGPVLVCGDGENDMDMMLTWMPCGDTQAGLILNHQRNRKTNPRLWAAAQEALSGSESPFLLQGLDKRQGRFRPAQTTLE